VKTFVVLRRGAWEDEDELDEDAAELARIADEEMHDQVKLIRSYVIEEEDGTFGTVCIYQAEDADALMEHAQHAELPADEVVPVVNTLIERDDP
jgi:hypothetical protein